MTYSILSFWDPDLVTLPIVGRFGACHKALVKMLNLRPALLVRQEPREVHHINSLSAINAQIREPFLHLFSGILVYSVVLSFHSSEYLHIRPFQRAFPSILLTPSSSTTPFTSRSFFCLT
jgi:hypothetical protein